ncbi:MAG: hypothetical protein D6732_17645 [Methanobacteriota archaeon]|nr:MAG: hypothetical protein D6732_17645 [Euryarchaeota archaeon]
MNTFNNNQALSKYMNLLKVLLILQVILGLYLELFTPYSIVDPFSILFFVIALSILVSTQYKSKIDRLQKEHKIVSSVIYSGLIILLIVALLVITDLSTP